MKGGAEGAGGEIRRESKTMGSQGGELFERREESETLDIQG